MFAKQVEFYKNNFETQFFHLAHFSRKLFLGSLKPSFIDLQILREKSFEVAKPVLGMFLDVYDMHDVLDASRCRILHRQWRDRRSFQRDCHGISW